MGHSPGLNWWADYDRCPHQILLPPLGLFSSAGGVSLVAVNLFACFHILCLVAQEQQHHDCEMDLKSQDSVLLWCTPLYLT